MCELLGYCKKSYKGTSVKHYPFRREISFLGFFLFEREIIVMLVKKRTCFPVYNKREKLLQKYNIFLYGGKYFFQKIML